MNALGSRRWWALGALALSLLVVGLDGTVLSVALPTLATRLHASTAQLQWFVDAYLLVLAAALLPAGLLGDRFGRKRLLLGALAVFGASSVACAYASSAGVLIGARAALGLSAAFLIPLSMAVLPVLFEPEERSRALGVWVTASAASFPIGPIVGGWLLDRFWWGSVFLINVPVIVLGLVAVAALVPESRNPRAPRLDVPGALTSSLGLAGVTYGFIEAGEQGWSHPAALAALVAGAVVLAGFALSQRGASGRPDGQSLVDLELFRSRSFTWGTTLATVISFSLFGLLFAMPQYFQAIEGASALGTGLRLLPVIGGLLVGSRLGDRVARRAGAKVTVASGLALMAGGLFAGATTGAASGYGLVAAWMSVGRRRGRHRAADGDGRRPRRALHRAQRGRVRADPGVPPGGQRHQGRGTRDGPQLVVPGRPGPGRAAGPGGRDGPRERLGRRRRRRAARLRAPARRRARRVRPRHGRHAAGLRDRHGGRGGARGTAAPGQAGARCRAGRRSGRIGA